MKHEPSVDVGVNDTEQRYWQSGTITHLLPNLDSDNLINKFYTPETIKQLPTEFVFACCDINNCEEEDV